METIRKITLSTNSIPNADMDAAADWLRTYPRMSQGPLVAEFEEKLARTVGSKHAVFVNSGSSANLLMLYALKVMFANIEKVNPNYNKVVVPGLAWATTLAPVMQLGMKPILCDVNMTDLSLDLDELERIFIEEQPGTMILVSVLGIVPDYDRIKALCLKHRVFLLEDACESLGSWRNGYVGTFGLMGSYSFFYSHQLCCVEGGAVVTDDDDAYQWLLMLREHGWTRRCSPEKQLFLKTEWNISDFNDMYTFYVPGFNFRNTEINAFFGLRQLDRFNHIANRRDENYAWFNRLVHNKWLPPPQASMTVTSNLGYPVVSENRDSLAAALISRGVECRPLISGSMGKQPMYVEAYGKKEMPNCNFLDDHGLYVPNSPEMTYDDVKYVADIINEFAK